MIIKLLYIILIFLGVRLLMNGLQALNKNQEIRKQQKQDDDIIDAEYKVVSEDEN